MYNNTDILPTGFTLPSLLSGMDDTAPILAAFSGGADSSALLHILSKYSKLFGSKIYAAHVNHGIRGAEADRDELFCRKMAESLGIEIFVLNTDIPKIAKETGESTETAARRVRYDFFEKIMAEHGIKILATAHNANDNLETVIFNISRGTGLGGICGIPETRPLNGGIVIRPILLMPKQDILKYCNDNLITYVTDSTNTDTDYTRNLIRAQIIPVMEKINTNVVRNAARMSTTLREDSTCLEKIAKSVLDDETDDTYSIETEKLLNLPASVANRVIIRMYCNISDGKILEYTHICALKRLATNAIPHSSVTLPGEFEGVIENGRLCLQKRMQKIKYNDYSIGLTEGSNYISQINAEIFIGNSHNAKNVYKQETILHIDSDKIVGALFARQRLPGDRIRSGGMNKSVKKLFCDKKIPASLRGRIPVICDDEGIVAIPFLTVRDGLKTKNDCKKITVHFYLY